MSLHISAKSQAMPASAIRKLVPLADAAKAKGVHVYHLNVGAPGRSASASSLSSNILSMQTTLLA